MRTVILGLAVAIVAACVAVPSASADNGLKISGYLQARVISSDRATINYPNVGTSSDIPRARLKAQYAAGLGSLVVEVDGATGGNPIIRDAYVQIPLGMGGEEKPLTLLAGQFRVPFGYAVLESSAVREFPERAAGFGSGGGLFANIRDRGVRLTYTAGALQADAAVVDGNGIAAAGAFDLDNERDVYGRLGYGLGAANIVGSVRVGKAKTTFGGTTTVRNLYGAGVDLPLPSLGGKLTGEYISGFFKTGANKAEPTTWYAQYIYPLGEQWKVGARWAYYNTATSYKENGPGFVAVYQLDEYLRLTGALELPKVTAGSSSKTATVGTVQTQYAF